LTALQGSMHAMEGAAYFAMAASYACKMFMKSNTWSFVGVGVPYHKVIVAF